MKRILLISGIVILLMVGQTIPVSAGTEDSGGIAVTLQPTELSVSISVSPDAVSYGTVSLGDTDVVPETPYDPVIVATNTGNCWVDMNIRGANTDGGWTLAATLCARCRQPKPRP